MVRMEKEWIIHERVKEERVRIKMGEEGRLEDKRGEEGTECKEDRKLKK